MTPRPKAADGAKEESAFFAVLARDEKSLSRIELNAVFAELQALARRQDAEVVDLNRRTLAHIELYAPDVAAQLVHGQDRFAETRHPQQGRPPVGNVGEVVHEPAQRGLHLIEGADDHHQLPKAHAALKVGRR